MEDQVAAGLFILDGNARVRTPSGLVKLQDLNGSGPQGPTRPAGPQRPAGTVDYSNIYTKAEVHGTLLFNENILQTGTHPGAKTWGGTLRQLRNVLGQNGVQTFMCRNQLDPNDPNTGNLVVDGSALQGGGIPTTIAKFLESGIYLKKDVLAQANLTVSYHLAANTALANSLDCKLLKMSESYDFLRKTP